MSYPIEGIQISTSTLFNASSAVKYANQNVDTGYTIYLAGSEATVCFNLRWLAFTDNRCTISCYKASSNNQWVFLESVDADTSSGSPSKTYNFAFNSSSSVASNKVYPEELKLTLGSNLQGYRYSHAAGTFTLVINSKNYVISVSQDEDLLAKIVSTNMIATGSTERDWLAEQGALDGNTVFFSSIIASDNISGLSINWGSSPIVDVGVQSDYAFVSTGRGASAAERKYIDFDCARWKVVITVPYGDKRVRGYVRANAYNTPNIINGSSYINTNYQGQYIYQWDQSLGKVVLSTVDNKTPDNIAKRIIGSTLGASGYKAITIRGKY